MKKLVLASASLSALSLGAAPRAVAALPRAEGVNPAAVLSELQTTVNDFISRNDRRVGDLEASINGVLADGAASKLGLGGTGGMPEDPEYSRTFASYVRGGKGEDELRTANAEGYRSQIHAAMSVGTPGDGGYLAPVEWDRMVRKAQQEISPMRRIAQVVTTGVGAFSTVWSNNAWGSGWVGETVARPETTTPALSTLEFAAGEIYANAAITQRLLDDSALNIESWLSSEIADEFTRQEGIAWLSGNGVNKPRGLLTYVSGGASDGVHPGGNLTVVNGGAAATVSADGLVDFAYSLPAPYRQGASWLMSSSTAATIAKLKDGDGNYLWREGYKQGEPATLLGYPVEIDEGMPSVAADALPIAFGNFSRGYLINDRLGVRTIRDPYTNKPFVNFYTTKRVGGGVLDPNAIRLLRIA